MPPTIIDALTHATGAELPAPETLEDAGLTIILMKTARDLASLGVYLIHTDHLSDRQLYEYLFTEGLREEAILFPDPHVLDLAACVTDEDVQTFLRYYADDGQRRALARICAVPDRETAPFDRDRFLPQSPRG
jgi:hypothetical protein